MQISENTTRLHAGLTVATDAQAREHCVVAIKGTFVMDARGEPQLAEVQRPLTYTDEHNGTPETTSLRQENDFAWTKPMVDILVQGHAVAPHGRETETMLVRVEMSGWQKDIRITGDRYWDKGMIGLKPTPPKPFVRMPLRYELAFGGVDTSHRDTKHHGAELRNPVGKGFRQNPRAADAVGTPLPNLEHPRHFLEKWDGRTVPMGFGPVGRSWQPRIAHAGTYDERWLAEDYPFLPRDFNPRYFQCAPEDQQLPQVRGGEVLRCLGLAESGNWTVTLPRMQVPVAFHFRDAKASAEARMDTVLLDADARVVVVTWRASMPLGKKLSQLREVHVGLPSPGLKEGPVKYLRGKPYFRGLGALVSWRRNGRRPGGTP
ncbi:DUF2169 family type VI secretion system accessory protein [Cystobacter ferrugineus]|uniref:DUF2169 domain-containing protein n=1 Tax=Cystobacter ferrugineus TaxID=83449 RepID=A0A1L9BI29_9BACT|nr:DUF2169 domain-containing protein [Cystobacter ferrugineus]OJH41954.1 hypothetical protein BON30_01615 [Cystobacter ferrugineus]